MQSLFAVKAGRRVIRGGECEIRLCDGFLLSGQTDSPKNPQDELFRCSPEKVRSAAMHSQHTVTLC
jgi:hypothetical protein